MVAAFGAPARTAACPGLCCGACRGALRSIRVRWRSQLIRASARRCALAAAAQLCFGSGARLEAGHCLAGHRVVALSARRRAGARHVRYVRFCVGIPNALSGAVPEPFYFRISRLRPHRRGPAGDRVLHDLMSAWVSALQHNWHAGKPDSCILQCALFVGTALLLESCETLQRSRLIVPIIQHAAACLGVTSVPVRPHSTHRGKPGGLAGPGCPA